MARDDLKALSKNLRETRFSFVPRGEHHLRDVYVLVQSRYPELCDDSYLCSENCKSGNNSPEWCHRVRATLQNLQRRTNHIRKSDQHGYWRFGDGNAANDIPETKTSADIDPPETERIHVSTFRILRDTALARRIKFLHEDSCQICGLAIELPDGSTYSEAHHIQPLGKPHDGPDIVGNILVLCPNHHAMCDYGAITLSISELSHHPEHEIQEQFIAYHNTIIAGDLTPGATAGLSSSE